MKQQREIENQDQYEKSIRDRMYLGTLILIGFVLGIAVTGCIVATFIKAYTGVWPFGL